MTNRVNSSGAALGNIKARSSLFISNVIPANETLPVPVAGMFFYVTAASAPIEIRPSGGIFNSYAPGTGLELDEVNTFSRLDIRNNNAFPVAFQVFIGFDKYIDKRLIYAQSSLFNVAKPTYPTTNASATVAITDVSGQIFTDINGKQWYAVQRDSIIISNTDAGVTLLLQKAGSIIANGPAIAAIYGATTLRLDVQGDYSLSTGGGNINAIVSEIYLAIPKV